MNKIKYFVSVLVLFVVFGVSAYAESMILQYDGGTYNYYGSELRLVVNNKKINPALSPIVFNDRALVPVRDVFEEVGAKVNYNADNKTIEVISDRDYIRMTINDNVAYVNGARTSIPDSVVPKLISKLGGETKTMVPVRFISETIGLDVDYDTENETILIESDGTTEKTEITPEPAVEHIQNEEYASEPEPTPIATPEPTSEPAVISSVTYKNVETGKIAVTVKMNKKAPYSYFTLDDPERLVVDIKGATIADGGETLYINNGGINALRTGVDPERSRIVIDMDKMVNYGFDQYDDRLVIYAKATSTSVATPAPTKSPTTSTTVNKTEGATTDITVKKEVVYDKNIIVIDAGHGGYDPGAQGKIDGKTINESDLTIQISYKVKELLEKKGYKVIMTRSDDTYKTLIERPQLANEKNAAIFVSVHINSVDAAPEANGTEVYYAESNNDDVGGVTSGMLAKNVLQGMISATGAFSRGVKTAEHAVTKRSNMPACLAEVGFITNENDVKNMTDSSYQYKVASGIVEGIVKTVGSMK